MVFTTPVLNYAQLSPILIVLAGAVIGVLIEAFAPRNARHNSQMFISLLSLVSALAATVSIRNQAGVDAAMNSVAFDGAAFLIQATILIIAVLAVFLIADQENFTALAPSKATEFIAASTPACLRIETVAANAETKDRSEINIWEL